ncbi:MAG: MlaD family protein [Verrucomicrobia bacterium]|nr:MlaD family protein [Verrucomicrobiota bacterium]
MSQKPNPTSIGLFIVIGLALGVTGLLLFSSSKMFTKTRDIVIYFNQSLNGLNVGAPVKYRGVTIGSVKRVMIFWNQLTNDFAMPVVVELEEKLIKERVGTPIETFTDTALEQRINQGMRASLQAESLVTGVLYVEMRLNPNATKPVFHQLKPIFKELPSEQTQIQQLIENLGSMDIKGISTNINAVIVRLDQVLESMRMGEMSAAVTNALRSIDHLVSSPDITNTLTSVRTALDQYKALGEKLTGRVDPLAESITNSLAEANRTLAQLRGTADNLKGMLRPDAPLSHNLDQLLRQLAGTAESVSSLMEFLKEHPNALITGREAPQKP